MIDKCCSTFPNFYAWYDAIKFLRYRFRRQTRLSFNLRKFWEIKCMNKSLNFAGGQSYEDPPRNPRRGCVTGGQHMENIEKVPRPLSGRFSWRPKQRPKVIVTSTIYHISSSIPTTKSFSLTPTLKRVKEESWKKTSWHRGNEAIFIEKAGFEYPL